MCQYSGGKRRREEGRVCTHFLAKWIERGRDGGRGVCMLTQGDILLLTALYKTSSENGVGVLTTFSAHSCNRTATASAVRLVKPITQKKNLLFPKKALLPLSLSLSLFSVVSFHSCPKTSYTCFFVV